MIDVWSSAADIAAAVRAGRLRTADQVAAVLDRAEGLGRLNAFVHLDRDGAMARAEAVDRQVASGRDPGPLAGVPVAVKDNLCTRDAPTTCGSGLLDGYRPPYDAHVVERLRAAGAVVLGKTNLDEFAMGSSSERSAFGPVKNPWDETRVPGGSSGGSAAATAAGLCAASLGSDTGGSVRQPGAFCGLVAIKPTYGRVSRYGLVAFASSLDQVGPIARSVDDAALLLQVVAGRDGRDATSADRPVPAYAEEVKPDVEGLRIGLVTDSLGDGCEPAVAGAVRSAVQRLAERGAEVVPIALAHARYAISAYYLLATAEASSNLARFDGMRYGRRVEAPDLHGTYAETRARGLGPEVKRRILLGTYALSAGYYDAFYLRALRVRTLICRDFDEALGDVDAVITPTAPTVAFKLGERLADPLAMYLADVFTLPASLAGLPAINVPCGSAGGLPVGLQAVGRAFDEGTLLRIAAAVEADAGLSDLRPPCG